MHFIDPQLTTPADGTRLWRYQTFDRFIQLLEARALWFARADQFEDRFEMAVPTRDLPAARAGLLNSLLNEPIIKEKVWSYLIRFAGLTKDELDAMPDVQLASLLPRFSNRFAYISSWHRNDAESAGLWAQYTGGGNGVAVRTTARAP